MYHIELLLLWMILYFTSFLRFFYTCPNLGGVNLRTLSKEAVGCATLYVLSGLQEPVPKSADYGKPTNQLNFKHCPRSVTEERVGHYFKVLRLLNSYWVGQDLTYNFFEIIMVDPYNKAICRDVKIN